VLAGVKQNGEALQYASEELRADREFMLAAVQQRGWALKYASQALRADREVVLAAVQQRGGERMLNIGDRATVAGVTKRPELNGVVVTITGKAASPGRFNVQCADGQVFSLKRDNLQHE